MRRLLAFIALLPALATGQPAPREEQPPRGAWPQARYGWYYNPRHAPSWLDAAAARELVQRAAAAWEPCGVRMEFLGETQVEPGAMDGVNVVGWQPLPGGMRGMTRGRSRAGELLERDVAFSPERAEFARAPRLLEKVMVHEFGHAIGLTHSARCDDVMTLAADCPRVPPAQLPLAPTRHDLARCRALYGPR